MTCNVPTELLGVPHGVVDAASICGTRVGHRGRPLPREGGRYVIILTVSLQQLPLSHAK